MFKFISEFIKPTTYRSSDFKHIVGSRDLVSNLDKHYPKMQFTVNELLKLEKIPYRDIVFVGSIILPIKKLESILLSSHSKHEIPYFYLYKNEHAKRLEFRYLMNKKHSI